MMKNLVIGSICAILQFHPCFAQVSSNFDSLKNGGVISLGTKKEFRFKGLAVDAMRFTAYLGSWDKKEIVAVGLDGGSHGTIETKYSGKLTGMGCYIRGDILYALMNEIDDDPKHQPISVLLMYDLDLSSVIRSYELRGSNGRHHFNHVVVDSEGIAYVSNTLKSSIYTVDTMDPKASFQLFIEHEDLSWVHGIDLSPDESRLFMTSYESGIRILDLKTKKFFDYKDKSTIGDDGLRYYKGVLYGVGQNRLKKYTLDKEQTRVIRIDTLLADHPYFNDPRCLDIRGDILFCLANMEFEPVTFRRRKQPAQSVSLSDSHLITIKLNDN